MSILDDTLKILSDLKWHCPCELPSAQPASTIRELRRIGYIFWENENKTRQCKNLYCEICDRKTPHRKLLSLEKQNKEINRIQFTPSLRQKILSLYDNKDVFTGSRDRLEIDHRITPNRVSEKPLPENVTGDELKRRYIVLSRVNNHIKREACNKCIRTNVRQPSINKINYFYEGSHIYSGTCEGCYWAYPEKWVELLNKEIGKE